MSLNQKLELLQPMCLTIQGKRAPRGKVHRGVYHVGCAVLRYRRQSEHSLQIDGWYVKSSPSRSVIWPFGEAAKVSKAWHVLAPDHPLSACGLRSAAATAPVEKKAAGFASLWSPEWPQGGRAVPWEGDQLSQEATPNWLHSFRTWSLKQIILGLNVFI